MSQHIAVENLSFTYPDGTKALKNVSFDVKRGEVFAIMGANGAGKTTLCYLLNGVIPNVIPGEVGGRIVVAGMEVLKHPIYDLSPKIGMLLEDPEGQLVSADVLGEVSFGPENLGLPRDEILRRIDWALKVVRLEGLEKRLSSELSGGQKQRLAIASVLTMLPEVLIMDEPTSQLDPIGTFEVLSVIKDIRQKYGMTIILVTHKSEQAAEFADRIMILNKGEVVTIGKPSDVFQELDSMEKLGVQPIPVSRLCQKLRQRNVKIERLPVTLDESNKLLVNLLEKRKVSVARIEKTEKNVLHQKGGDQPVLEARNLTYIYPGPPPVLALKDINLKIFEGEFLGVIGQNGSGKTTLVKNFLNVLQPTQGEVLFKGKNIKKYHIAELSTKIGLILQNPDHQLFSMSVKGEIEFGLKNLGLPDEEIKAKVDDALEFAGLKEEKDTFPFRLSFGHRRKVVVAAIAAMEPEVIILDEPTTGQDYLGRYSVMELAKRLNDKGHTVIAITHDMDLIAEYTNRTIVMSEGKILLDGPTSWVFTQTDVLEKAFLKPPQITRLAQVLRAYDMPSGVLTVDEMLMYFRGGSE